jgi:hypothetical protein
MKYITLTTTTTLTTLMSFSSGVLAHSSDLIHFHYEYAALFLLAIVLIVKSFKNAKR